MTTTNSIPTALRALPLLGHLGSLVRDPLAFLASLPERGDLVRIRLGPVSAVVVCDRELASHVLRDDRTFDKGGVFFDRLRELLGDGVGTCPRSRHRRQRRLAQTAFHNDRLPGYARVMTAEATAVTESWHDEQVLDVLTEMMSITSRTVASAMFSDILPAIASRQALEDLTAILAGVYRRMLMPRPLTRLPTPGNRRYHQAIARLRHTLAGVIASRRAGSTDTDDLLSVLLAARDFAGDGQGLADTEIADQVITIFSAGTGTAADTLAWALHLLAQHPDIAALQQTEVDMVLGGRSAVHTDLPRLELTGRVVTETLRLWPPIWLITRTVTVDTVLGGRPLPAGTTVVYSPYLLHRQPDLYPYPDRFDPGRWLPERAKAIPRDAFIPFGGGARKCLGDTFAVTEATLALATITARWRLESLPGRQRVRPAPSITLAPRGLRMRAIARETAAHH